MSDFLHTELGNWLCGFFTGLGVGAVIVDWCRR